MDHYIWNMIATKAYRWFYFYYFFTQKPGMLLLRTY